MNDFTKEELICVRDNLVVPEEYKDKNILLNAYHKLIGMIDSYCEHQQRVASSDDNGHIVLQCGRCDLVLWHEKD